MKPRTVVAVTTLAAICLTDVAVLNVAQAFNMGDMFSPGEWFDNDDDYYDRYRGGPYGPYGYGGPYGGYGPYGYGGPYGGYGYGGYPGYGGHPGYGGYPGYGGQPSTIVVNPSGTGEAPPPPRLPE